MDVSDIGGTLILLLVFIALKPIFEVALNILIPQLGATETLIATSIPTILLLLIAVDVWDSGEETQLRR